MPPSKPPRILLTLDFDGTLTHTDTTAAIVALSPAFTPDLWSSIASAYAADFSAHAAAYPVPADRRTSVPAERAWLESLRGVEARSVARVRRAGLWRGVDGRRVRRGAESAVREGGVVLREGWEGLFGSGRAESVHVVVVSVSWSRAFVRGCLVAGAREKRDLDLEEVVGKVDIRANELEGVENDTSVIEDGELRTSADKLRVMKRHWEEGGLGGVNGISSLEPLKVYVGDSTTDFDCLVESDVGICLRDGEVDEQMSRGQRDLESTLRRVELEVTPLEDFNWRGPKNFPKSPKTVYWTSSLASITDLLRKIAQE